MQIWTCNIPKLWSRGREIQAKEEIKINKIQRRNAEKKKEKIKDLEVAIRLNVAIRPLYPPGPNVEIGLDQPAADCTKRVKETDSNKITVL